MATTALKAVDKACLKESSESSPRSVPPVSRRVQCVLLIEDSEDAMLLVQYALYEDGCGKYKLVWASCLSDGLSRVKEGGIDIVLLDLGLPEASGAVSYAKLHEAAPELPVVVLTGDTREETELSVFSKGVEDYLVKDQVSGSLLINAIETALERKKAEKRHSRKSS